MEKTYMRTTHYRIAFIVSISINIISIILSMIMIMMGDMFASIASFCVMTFLSLFGWFAFYIERKGKLVLTENSITFYYTVFTKPRIKYTYDFGKGYKIDYKDIKKYTTEFHPGDGITSADTTWYIFILNNETEVRFALFHFGKKQELEIKNNLNKYINK